MDWSLLLQEIEKYDSIAIYRHENPDVDACGSQFGLKTWLNNNYPEKHVYAFGEEVCTQRYFPENDIEEEDIVKNCLAISLDTANEPRMDGKYFNVAKKKIKIDHHPNREPYGDLEFVDPKYAATCEILTEFFSSCKNQVISKETAEYLYSGLLTDTLCFRTTNTTSNSLKMASILTSYDLNIAELNRTLFDQSLEDFAFGTYIRKNVDLINDKLAYVILSRDVLEDYHIDASRARSMIDELGHVKEFEIWIIFTEEMIGDEVKYSASLRSKTIPVNDVAQMFGGGGHINASGIKNLNYSRVIEILEIFKQRI